MNLRRGILPQFVLVSIASCVFSTCAAKDVSAVSESVDGVTVITAGKGIGTDLRPVIFKGRIGYRAEGRIVPLTAVSFTRRETPDRDPESLDVRVNKDGRFESTLFLVTTVSGRHRWNHGTTVTIESPGCSPLSLYVNDDWKPRTLELVCESR